MSLFCKPYSSVANPIRLHHREVAGCRKLLKMNAFRIAKNLLRTPWSVRTVALRDEADLKLTFARRVEIGESMVVKLIYAQNM